MAVKRSRKVFRQTGRRVRARSTGSFAKKGVARGYIGRSGDQHFVDATITQAVIGTTATLQHISIVPQDSTVNGRNGRAFRCQTARIRLTMSPDSTAQLNFLKYALVWDYQPNKALAAYTDIYDAATVQSQPKKENDMRFKIIKEWNIKLPGNATLALDNSQAWIDTTVRLPRDANVILTTADTTGVIGDVIQGALIFTTLGTNGAGTTDAGCIGTVRVNFSESVSGVYTPRRM